MRFMINQIEMVIFIPSSPKKPDMEFFDQMAPLLKAFWYVAIPVSLVFIIQSVMTFIGVDATDGLEADFDSNLDGADSPFQLFSFRNLVNFLLGFSWTGISLYGKLNNTLLIIAATIVGIGFVMLFFLIIRQVQKLAENNSFSIKNTLHKTAEVYLTIPGQKSGKGKVLISVKGSVRELGAITEGDKIETGKLVLVSGIENNELLIVKPL